MEGDAKQNNVGVKHTQRHPKSCFFSPFSVFCFFFGLPCVCMCLCVHVHIYMCTHSQGSICCSCAEPMKEGRAEDFRRRGNPGDNVKYFISPAFVAALLCSLSVIWTLTDVFLNKDWDGNSAGNKGVKIHIKSEFLYVKIYFFSSLFYPHSGFLKDMSYHLHCMYFYCWTFFFLPVLNSLWNNIFVSQYEFPVFVIHLTNNAYNIKSTECGSCTLPQQIFSPPKHNVSLKICAYYKQYHK